MSREAATGAFDTGARELNIDWGTNLDGKQVQRWGEARGQTLVSRKRVMRLCKKITAMAGRSTVQFSPTDLVAELNPVLRGWAGYFCIGPVSDTYQTINSHVRYRFRKWWQAKHKGPILRPCWY